MKSIITLMADIEKEASSILDSASEKKVQMYNDFQNKMTEIDEKYKEKLELELEKINNKCSVEYNNKIKEVQTSTDNSIEELEALYKSNKAKYIDKLFNRVIRM